MKSGLFAFILLSTLVHAAVLSIQNEWVFSIYENHEQGSSTLDIELADKSQKIVDSAVAKTDNTFSARHKLSAPLNRARKPVKQQNIITAAIKKETAVTQHAISRQQQAPAHRKLKKSQQSANSQNSGHNKNHNNEKIKTLLNNELAKHFYYPKAAQRKNCQGHVILAFTINSDGIIENIHINKSSGYSILDKAAINALNKIDANEDLAQELNGHSIEHILPVTYRLTSL